MKLEIGKHYWVEWAFDTYKAKCLAVSERGGAIFQFNHKYKELGVMVGHISERYIHAEADAETTTAVSNPWRKRILKP